MLYLTVAATGGAVYLLLMFLYQLATGGRTLINERLEQIGLDQATEDAVTQELNVPLKQRVFKPLIQFAAGKASRALPEARRKRLDQKLTWAGNPGNLTPQEFLALKYILILLMALGGALVFARLGLEKAPVGAGVGMVIGLLGMELYLKQLTSQRQREIAKSLPYLLDLLTVSVEAGLGFDAALAKVVEKTSGPMTREFRKVLQEIKMGIPRREALRAVSLRVGMEGFTNLVNAIIQSDQLGVSMGNMLRVQSEKLRQKRRQRAEEQAMKAPVKMLLPLVFFVFPCIFIVLLGPALIELFRTLKP